MSSSVLVQPLLVFQNIINILSELGKHSLYLKEKPHLHLQQIHFIKGAVISNGFEEI